MIRSALDNLGDKLTVEQLRAVSEELISQLSRYELEETEPEETNVEIDEFLQLYISAKRIEGRSEKTLDRYQYIIRKALTDIHTPYRQLTVFHFRKYLSDQKARGLSDKTLEGTRSIIAAFFGWLQREGLIERNPCGNLGVIKCPKKMLFPFSPVEIEKLKENCSTVRDRAIINFLLSTGCRISEMCGLNQDNINFEKLECVVYGKGAKERTVYIDSVTSMLVKRYLESRTDSSEALFVGKGSDRLTPGGVRFMLKKVAERADVENVHPHRFRRTLATGLINHGMAIQEVAMILGHDNVNTTMGYVYTDKLNVKNNYRKLA